MQKLTVTEMVSRNSSPPAKSDGVDPWGLDIAAQEIAAKWLASLGVLCAGNLPVADARVKMAAYLALLDYPSECYTEATLRKAARAFKFFPSFAELSEFLGEQARPMRAGRPCLRGAA